MNEFSPISGENIAHAAAASFGSPPAPPSVAIPGMIMFSEQFDQIATVMATAHGKMISPRRNRTVRVQPRDKSKSAYTFRYTTLDVMVDMARQPLAEAGIWPTHFLWREKGGQSFLFTRLIHGPSGQWMQTCFPVAPDGPGPQAIGGGMSFAKRYNYAALLDIASDEDDDGNSAAGNDYRYVGVDPESMGFEKHKPERDKIDEIVVRRVKNRYMELIKTARAISGTPDDQVVPDMAHALLHKWQAELDAFSAFRTDPERAASWPVLKLEMGNSLTKLFGQEIATLWLSALTADAPDQFVALRKAWECDAIKALKVKDARSYAFIAEHFRAQAKRVEGAEQAEQEALDEPTPDDTQTPAAEDPPATEQEIGADIAQAETSFQASAFSAQVLNAQGEPGTVFITDPFLFVRAYANEWLSAANEAEREAIEEHNGDSLALACELNDEAALFIVDLNGSENLKSNKPHRSVESYRVDLPVNGTGTPQLAVYISACATSLQSVSARELPLWIEANAPTYNSLPNTAKLRILGHIAARRAALGVAA